MCSASHSRDLSSNPELRDEVVKQVLIKEEMLKREEERLRGREKDHERNVELKQKQFQVKENALKEMVWSFLLLTVSRSSASKTPPVNE